MDGTHRSLRALPIVKTDMVVIRAMRARMMVLDFNVIRVAERIPAFVAIKGPMENKGGPSVVKGSSNQRKKIKLLMLMTCSTMD